LGDPTRLVADNFKSGEQRCKITELGKITMGVAPLKQDLEEVTPNLK
jgi:hypothetical protein